MSFDLIIQPWTAMQAYRDGEIVSKSSIVSPPLKTESLVNIIKGKKSPRDKREITVNLDIDNPVFTCHKNLLDREKSIYLFLGRNLEVSKFRWPTAYWKDTYITLIPNLFDVFSISEEIPENVRKSDDFFFNLPILSHNFVYRGANTNYNTAYDWLLDKYQNG